MDLFQEYIPLSYRVVNQGPSEYTIRLIYPRLGFAAVGRPHPEPARLAALVGCNVNQVDYMISS